MCCQYWPMELDKPEKYGLIEVTLLSEDTMANFVIRTLRLRRVSTSFPIHMVVMTIIMITHNDDRDDEHYYT